MPQFTDSIEIEMNGGSGESIANKIVCQFIKSYEKSKQNESLKIESGVSDTLT